MTAATAYCRVVDNAFWIAALTGGTAVLASWVTNQGNAKAARIQADSAAETQRMHQLRESRRAAYIDLIEHTHRMAELYWEVSTTRQISDAGERLAARTELRDRERDEYAKLRRCVRVIDLEGPPDVVAAAEALKDEVSNFYAAFKALLADEAGAERDFDNRYRPFWAALTRFTEAARQTLHAE
ncbi:hypothetical protein JW613_14290 [Streptomyces smyrnaeus]|uniref:Uncharacterized protein n=1 Tax=Streptomyces smyrnaeus TaxID=1387713 RepID=A0ABS3XVP1_9ACTN|nr:hypothetical protein [Streptomyces smyrnaeus]